MPNKDGEEVQGSLGKLGLTMFMQRALTIQAMEDIGAQQKSIFRTQCEHSKHHLEKLALPLIEHPRSYKWQWINDGGIVKVTQQVLVPLKISRYEDEVLWDVVPMEVAYMLLGRPWQFDRQVKHDGYTNKY